jgi:pimeloyl-ACP methyl ester carboxylesterase
VLFDTIGGLEAASDAVRRRSGGMLDPTMAARFQDRAEDAWSYGPGRLDGVTAPTLLLAGAESHPVLRQATDRAPAAIPGARVQVLEGHAHLAYRSDPAMVAAAIRRFAGAQRPRVSRVWKASA